MNFKQMGLGLAATAAMAAGTMLAEKPAQALDLAPGSFQLTSTGASVTATQLNPTQIQLNLSSSAFQLVLGSQTGVFAPSQLSGTPTIQNLVLTGSGPIFTGAALTNWITGLTYGANTVSIDLGPTTFGGFFNNGGDFALAGATTILGTIRDSASNQALAAATITALNIANAPGQEQSTITIGTAVIPTPALLPGLVGMGLAALRKRKNEAEEPEKVNA